MRKSNLLLPLLIIFIALQSQIHQSNSQQPYVNNNQLDCNKNFSNTNGFQCNGNRSSCTAYVTFRSQPPYTTPPNIAFLLNSSASTIAQLNNVSEVNPVPTTRLLIIPVSCSCTTARTRNSTRYYQHNAEYRLQNTGETYFTIANNAYQGLTTCQAMINQNPYNITGLNPGDKLLVPIMCACPTTQQKTQYNSQYLLSYLVTMGDNLSQIADMFGADLQTVLDANELSADATIYPYTPILVPLKSVPTPIKLSSPPPQSPPPASSPDSPGGSSSNKGLIIGVAVGVGIFVVVVVLLLLWFFLVRRPRKNPVATTDTSKEKDDRPFYTPTPTTVSYSTSQISTKSSSVDQDGLKLAIGSLNAYKFKDIEEATGKFSEGNRIKGSVYRGEFNGDKAAVKILKGNVSNDEINILNHINHSNIVRLSGYCIHEGNTYLVFEYAEKGSLDDLLFHQKKHQSEEQDSLFPTVLGWKQRVQIACNIADALNYLHSYIQPPYIHKNLKTSNVVLDRNLRAKITNFGLARTILDQSESGVLHLTKHVVGTHGYLAPEYIENGAVTTKLDVFSFGVVILELLSGQPAVTPSGANNGGADDLLFKVIRKMFDEENVREKLIGFMDSNLGRDYPKDLAYSMAQLGYKCVDPDVNSRPSMSQVSMTLSKIYSSSLDWDLTDEVTSSSSFSHAR